MRCKYHGIYISIWMGTWMVSVYRSSTSWWTHALSRSVENRIIGDMAGSR